MSEKTWLGHPRGLATLFFTEMWERFTYYGMRAILVFFLAAAATEINPGLGLTREEAGAIYGLYTGAVYLFSLPGGWIADRLIGSRRAVFWGGLFIAAGNFALAIPGPAALFFVGLAIIVVGVGLLKPNVSALVGTLYEGNADVRRDAGFSIFYMGINLGAAIAPFVVGAIGENWSWRLGFGAAGVFMLGGVIQYRLTEHYLGSGGLAPAGTPEQRRAGWRLLAIAVVALLAVAAVLASGLVPVGPSDLAKMAGVAMAAVAIGFFGYMLLFADLTRIERGRVAVIAILFLSSATFWAGFEQAATSLNLFAQDYTDRALLGAWFPSGEHPASWYQAANPVYIILFAPFFAALWVRLGRRNLDPAAPAKFGLALIQMGLGFIVIMFAAQLCVTSGAKVAPTWLLLTYLLHTTGELCLAPVGMSNVTRLAPPRYVGQLMGTWFLGLAVGNLAAGLIGGHVGGSDIKDMPDQFLSVALLGLGAGGLMLLISKPVKKLMALPAAPDAK
ncbi:peptide MFS transporter [Solimonas variicoloris]|uniref:peptide MFS transporter n=1 Tax=Solimonas variicoloris TaxID=254408 RepID=UPI00035FB48E|nr:peptide MFS transporter [Solimonas variicoloris]